MSAMRSVLHSVRNRLVAFSRYREFNPIGSPSRRIVVVRPDHFGDLLMLEPALDSVRKHLTDDELILMTGPWNREIAEHVTGVDRVITFPFPGFAREPGSGGLLAPYQQIAEAANVLRELAPRAIVLMRDDHWWGAWMAREAGVPLRFGYASRQVEPFLTHPLDVSATHYVEQNLDVLVRSLSVLGYQIPSIDDPRRDLRMSWPRHESARTTVRDLLGPDLWSSPFAVIHPGSGAPVKLWPAERWASVADVISSETGLRIVLTGTPDESTLCNEIDARSTSSLVNFAGTTTLFELAEVMRQARLVLGVDSGPLHLATAVDTPSVALFGPSDRRRYGPWGDPRRHQVVHVGMQCPRCGDLSPNRRAGCGCMMAIRPGQVTRAAIEVLNDVR